MTMGIVSAKGRNLEGAAHTSGLHPDRCRHQPRQLRRRPDQCQGRLIGMNTAIFAGGAGFGGEGGNVGIGFAVP